MNSQKFYYGEDIIEKTREYQLSTQITSIARSKSENRGLIKLKSKSKTSNSPFSKSQLSALKNITEYHQSSAGQERIIKRKMLCIQRELPNQDISGSQLSSQNKITIIKAPFKKIQRSAEKTLSFSNKMKSHLHSFDNEQQFIQTLNQKDQKPERIDKLIKARLAKMINHTHQRSQQTEISSEKLRLPSQSSFRRESQKEFKDKKQVELKQQIYKLILTFEYTCQIYQGKNKLENFLGNEQKYVGYMNFTYNLTNLPLNIEGLGQMFKGTKYLLKTLKPCIPQNLEKLIFEDLECQKFRQLTFQFQIFYILNNHSELIDTFTNQVIRFSQRQSKECLDLYRIIEKQFLMKNFNDIEQIQKLFEKNFDQSYELLLNEAKSFCNLEIEYDYVKQLYCFCIKVQEALSQKIQYEGNKKQIYEKGFDFKTALSKIKSKDINHDKLFAQYIPQKHEIIHKLDQFENKFGRIESISNIQREQAKLADLKHNQLYEKILKLQKQIE